MTENNTYNDIDTMRQIMLSEIKNPFKRWRVKNAHGLSNVRSLYYDYIINKV